MFNIKVTRDEIILASLAFLLALVSAEIILRVFEIGYWNSPIESHPIFHHVHPKDYIFKSHDPKGEFGGHLVIYDKKRLRVGTLKNNIDKENIKFRIFFLGDSMVEAVQVSYENSFVGILDSHSDNSVEIKNYGVSSYSTIFYLLQGEKLIEELNPTHLFVLLSGNDIKSDENYKQKAKLSINGDVIAIPGDNPNLIKRLLRKLYLIRLIRKVQLKINYIINKNTLNEDKIIGGNLEEAPDISEYTANILLKLNKLTSKNSTKFILMAVPSKYKLQGELVDYNYIDFAEKVRKWAVENEVFYLDLSPTFEMSKKTEKKMFFEKDIHLNEKGHKLIAEVISKSLPDIFLHE